MLFRQTVRMKKSATVGFVVLNVCLWWTRVKLRRVTHRDRHFGQSEARHVVQVTSSVYKRNEPADTSYFPIPNCFLTCKSISVPCTFHIRKPGVVQPSLSLKLSCIA